LEKLQELGFSRFEFNEELDFTKEIYDVSPLFRCNFRITYVANVQVIPNYVDHINYKTSDSNYKMELEIIGDEISEYGRKIILNSLLFDPSTLPINVEKVNTFGHILWLKNQQKEKSAIIRNLVDLSISISDLEHQLNLTDETISKLDGVKNKEELVVILLGIREDIEKLKTLSAQHDSNVLEQEPLLTLEILEREKSLCLRRRYMSSVDWR